MMKSKYAYPIFAVVVIAALLLGAGARMAVNSGNGIPAYVPSYLRDALIRHETVDSYDIAIFYAECHYDEKLVARIMANANLKPKGNPSRYDFESVLTDQGKGDMLPPPWWQPVWRPDDNWRTSIESEGRRIINSDILINGNDKTIWAQIVYHK